MTIALQMHRMEGLDSLPRALPRQGSGCRIDPNTARRPRPGHRSRRISKPSSCSALYTLPSRSARIASSSRYREFQTIARSACGKAAGRDAPRACPGRRARRRAPAPWRPACRAGPPVRTTCRPPAPPKETRTCSRGSAPRLIDMARRAWAMCSFATATMSCAA